MGFLIAFVSLAVMLVVFGKFFGKMPSYYVGRPLSPPVAPVEDKPSTILTKMIVSRMRMLALHDDKCFKRNANDVCTFIDKDRKISVSFDMVGRPLRRYMSSYDDERMHYTFTKNSYEKIGRSIDSDHYTKHVYVHSVRRNGTEVALDYKEIELIEKCIKELWVHHVKLYQSNKEKARQLAAVDHIAGFMGVEPEPQKAVPQIEHKQDFQIKLTDESFNLLVDKIKANG